LRALTESAHLAGLTKLVLGYNGIGNAGVQALLSAPLGDHLAELDLRHNNFPPSARAALRERFADRIRGTE
jgi:hypothetical protein